MTATNLLPAFNGPALGSSRRLSPIVTIADLVREHRSMRLGLDFDWIEFAAQGHVWFFRWRGSEEAIVLAVVADDAIIRVEAQAAGERPLADDILREIVADLATLIRHPPSHRRRGPSH